MMVKTKPKDMFIKEAIKVKPISEIILLDLFKPYPLSPFR